MPVSIAPEWAWYDATTSSDEHFPNPKLSNPGLLTKVPKWCNNPPDVHFTKSLILNCQIPTDLVQMIWCNLELTSTNFLEDWSLWKVDHFERVITLEGWSLWKGDHFGRVTTCPNSFLGEWLSCKQALASSAESKLTFLQDPRLLLLLATNAEADRQKSSSQS